MLPVLTLFFGRMAVMRIEEEARQSELLDKAAQEATRQLKEMFDRQKAIFAARHRRYKRRRRGEK